MSSVGIIPIPFSDPIAKPKREKYAREKRADPQEGLITQPWVDFLTAQGAVIASAPARIGSVTLSDQTASIGATDISGGGVAAGIYRLGYYLRVSQAAGTSSSLTATLDWKDRATVISVAGAAVTGNTLSTFTAGSSGIYLIRIDAASPVRYAVAYTSVGAPVLKFDLVVVFDRVDV